MILTIRTDKPYAEIGLYDQQAQLSYKKWSAHRQLAESLHKVIRDELAGQGRALTDLTGIIVYEGPGSFTGLRIGISVAQALGYGLGVPVVACGDENWIEDGQTRLQSGIAPDTPISPVYGADPNITAQKK